LLGAEITLIDVKGSINLFGDSLPDFNLLD
jgi:hypothetical protein